MLVATHSWDTRRPLTGINHVPTLEEWRQASILTHYQTMTIVDVLDLLKEKEDIYLITDTKHTDKENVQKAFAQIVDFADEAVLDRIIPQIYHPEMLDWIQEIHPFQEVIYTLYKSNQSSADIIHYVSSQESITAVTMWGSRALAEPQLVASLHEKGIFVYAHTINSIEESDQLSRLKVHGIYTDSLTVFFKTRLLPETRIQHFPS